MARTDAEHDRALANGEFVLPGAARCTELDCRPPFAWAALVDFLQLRGAPQVEGLRGGWYVRTLAMAGRAGWCAVRQVPSRGMIQLYYDAALEPVHEELSQRVGEWLDVAADTASIDAALGADPHLSAAVGACPGLRVPGACDGFELALRTVLGQQVSVRGATTLYARFVERFGTVVETPFNGITRTPPRVDRVAAEPVESIAELGLPHRRAQTIKALATAMAAGDVTLNRTADIRQMRERLLAMPGIGPWTVEYLAMRGLRDADAFPASDLGVLHGLGVKTARQAEAAAQNWRPWRAYAVMHLWRGAAGG